MRGELVGIGFRLKIDPLDINTIIAPPFLGSTQSLKDLTGEQREKIESSNKMLDIARHAGFIPVRYEIGRTVENHTEALERLRAVVALGVSVSEMVIVPTYPRKARYGEVFINEQPATRSYTKVDEFFTKELISSPIPEEEAGSDMRNAS